MRYALRCTYVDTSDFDISHSALAGSLTRAQLQMFVSSVNITSVCLEPLDCAVLGHVKVIFKGRFSPYFSAIAGAKFSNGR